MKVSGKAVEASLPQFYTMAERGGSFVTSMTGDPGAAEATMSLTLGMKWSASDVITKKLFGTDTKAGDWLERGLLRVTGVGANRADALDWIVSNAKTLERSGGVENKNKVYAIVSLLKGLENREISEKLTKDPRFEHITTVIESGTAELGTWTIRTKSGEVWSEKKISEAEFAEYKEDSPMER